MLQAPKNSHGDINSLSSACYKLNSVQLRALLENYRPAADELNIPRCVKHFQYEYLMQLVTALLILIRCIKVLCALKIAPTYE